MNTKITALLITAALAISPLSAFGAGYYPEVEFPPVNSQEFVAYTIDIEDYNKAEAEVKKSARLGAEQLDEALLLLDSISTEVQTTYALAYIKASQQNTEENNKTVSDIYTVISEISERMSALIMDLYNVPSTRASITEWMGGEALMQEFISTYPTERYYELCEQENQLLNQYRNHSLGTYIYTADDGNSYTLSDLDAKMTELINAMNENIENDEFDYHAAYTEYDKLSRYVTEYLYKSSEQVAGIFASLVKVRDKIAAETGFNSYADYAHAIYYSRDYTSADIAQLRENVKTHIVPLIKQLECISENINTAIISEEDIVPSVQEHIGKISPELSDSFNYMLNSTLVDLKPSLEKVTPGIAYTMDIPAYCVPFVFISPVEGNTSWTLETLVHEFGHFNANLYNGLAFSEGSIVSYSTDIDISEIHSQGLEVLFADYYDEIYPKNASLMYFNRLYSLLCSIVDGCALDEWQEAVYNSPHMSIDEMNELYLSINSEYGLENVYSYEWTQIPHNFEEPMYYISYAVSAVAALDIWVQSLTDREGAIDRYMRTTAYDGSSAFNGALNELGYGSVFEESTIKKISDEISAFASLGYGDISIDDWYWQAVLETKDFIDNSQSTGFFRPQEGILRSEMANSIGMMHEKSGNTISNAHSPFSDAPESKYIAWAAENGIIKGYDSTTFGSADTLTREQAVTILYRYANGTADSDVTSLANFSDYTEISAWAQEAFVWAVNEGIIRGVNIDDSTSLLNPHDIVTRAEAAQMIARLNDYNIAP